jgi:hypothetical protein
LCRELHEQIVLVLPVVNWFAAAAFPGGEENGVPAPRYGPRLETHHASEAESATGDIAVCHPHQPIDAPELILTAVASVVQKLRERGTVSHDLP